MTTTPPTYFAELELSMMVASIMFIVGTTYYGFHNLPNLSASIRSTIQNFRKRPTPWLLLHKRTYHVPASLLIAANLVVGTLGLCAIAVAFAAMCLSSSHSVVNLIYRTQHLAIADLIKDELTSGAFALRWTSVSIIVTWVVNLRMMTQILPRRSELEHFQAGPERLAAAIRISEVRNADRENFFREDNKAKHLLSGLPHRLSPTGVFVFQMLHLGFLCLATCFCWILVADGVHGSTPSILNWALAFASHDVGIVFGYVYLLRGRMLGFHRLRIYASALAISALMIQLAWMHAVSLGQILGPFTLALSVLSAALLIGIYWFEHAMVYLLRKHTVDGVPPE
jgi:hypothetical protein